VVAKVLPAMNDAPLSRWLFEPLSAEEMQTLRRIANGGAFISLLREQDVKHLVRLKLIEVGPRRAKLTERGRQRHDTAGRQEDC
jgi:hypothetical protein